MKKSSKLLCFIVVFVSLIAVFCTVSFAATVGQELPNVEDASWQRIDNINSKIQYNGSWQSVSYSGFWGGSLSYSTTSGSSISFKFYGTKIRIITQLQQQASTNTKVTIDGAVDYYSEYNSAGGAYQMAKYLVYEKSNLELDMHTVVITLTSSNYTRFDAIDIDATGSLLDPNTPSTPGHLGAVSGDKQVSLSWNTVGSASSYIIKRAVNPGGPYNTIKTVTDNKYTDTDVTNANKYYYIVTAVVNGVESAPSNEASATPTAPVIVANPGILEITMTNGQIKEYDLTGAELLAFLNWYDGRADGVGKAYCTITKKNIIKPFLSRKEYLAYDKISSFEVKEYAE